jgi:hypothetical protein
MNSRPLDVHTWSDYPGVNTFVDEILPTLTSVEGNERINKKLLKVLLLDLYVAWVADPNLMLRFDRDNSSYKAKSRYNEIHIGKKIIGLVDTLIQEGIICQKTGFNDRVSRKAFLSRIWASDFLKGKFNDVRFNQFHVYSHEDREPLILRDSAKKDIEYDDTEGTDEMRKLLSDYNSLLSETHIDIHDLEEPVIVTGEGRNRTHLQVNQKSKFVSRIFNNERWDQGGRFYGGWWQRCPKEYRKKIVMDDILTAEIDYSGLHICILYAQEGIDYWGEGNEDPYALHGINDINPEIELRAAAKLLLLTALNAENETKTFQAFRSQATTGSAEKKMTNDELSTLLSALKRKHEPIAHKLASGAGIDLMFVDSRITAKIIERFTYHYKSPILTVHDSYIVPIGYDLILKREMKTAFEEVVGPSDTVVEHTTDYFFNLEHGLTPDEQVDHTPIEFCERYKADWQLFREFKNKPERSEWVPDWTMIY